LISFDLTCYVFVTSGFGKAEIEVTIASSFVSQFLIVKIEYGLFVWVTIEVNPESWTQLKGSNETNF